MTKSCHLCGTAVPSGFTCPSCDAFVPDPPAADPTELADQTAPADQTGDTSTAPTSSPGTFPSWAVATDTGDAESPPAAAFPSWSVPSAPPQGSPSTGPTDARPQGLAARLGQPAAAPAPAPVGSTPASLADRFGTPVLLAAGMGAVIVVLIIVALVLPRRSSDATVSSSIVGTCFVYGADRTTVDKTVSCDALHEGKVLASVGSRAACPSGTTAVLTTKDDANGTSGVLCVAEPG